jgi:methionine aminopeptidase type I
MVLKTAGELDLMDEANRVVHRVLDGIADRVRPGVTTRELDRFAEETIRAAGAAPAFLNYKGYPATLCTSRNDVIVHGIPGDEVLREGDILGVDCGVVYKGYYGDAARTYAVGRVSPQAERLIAVTRRALRWRSNRSDQTGGSQTSVTRSRAMSSLTASRSSGSSWATESAPRSTRSPRCRISASRARGRS